MESKQKLKVSRIQKKMSSSKSVRENPIPDLAYESYRAMSLREQTLVKRHLTTNSASGGYSTHFNHSSDNYFPQEEYIVDPHLYSQYHHLYLNQQNNVNNESEEEDNNPGPSSRVNESQSEERVVMQRQEARTARMTSSIGGRRPSNMVVSQGMAYSLEKYWGESLAFWILLGVLTLLVVANSVLTFVIYGVLRLGLQMESIEVTFHCLLSPAFFNSGVLYSWAIKLYFFTYI